MAGKGGDYVSKTKALPSCDATNGTASFRKSQELRHREIRLLALLHEGRHLFIGHVEELEAIVGHLPAVVRVAVNLREHAREALSHVRRGRLGPTDASVTAVHPIDAELPEGRHFGEVGEPLLGGNGEQARFPLLRERKRGI